jgi:hypothetical protein
MGRLPAQCILRWLAAFLLAPALLLPGFAADAPTSVEFIPSQSWWKFLDDGSDPGVFWRFAFFNDNGWRSGPGQFGYGEGDEASIIYSGVPPHLTHYFRFKFTVANPQDFTNLLFRVLRDDGVVVYLNGNEIFRMNMPDGPIDGSTPAATTVTIADENTYFPTNLPPTALVQGTNIVAVELHQTPAPADASFDLSLTGIGPPAATRLVTERQSGQVLLRWDNANMGLQQQWLPDTAWSWVTNATSPYPVPSGGSRLFRLRSR